MTSVHKEHIKTLKGPDLFQVKVMAGVDWAVRNVRLIAYVLVPVVAAIGVLAGYRVIQSKRQDSRIEELGKIQVVYNGESKRAADKQKPILKKIQDIEAKPGNKAASPESSGLTPQQEEEIAALRKEAEAIKPDHSSSSTSLMAFYQKYEQYPEGWLAAMMAAHVMIDDSRIGNAATVLEGLVSKVKSNPTYLSLVTVELAGLAEEQGDFDKELSLIGGLEKTADSELRPKLALMKGRALYLKGDKEGAKTTLATLVDGYASSAEAQKARSLLTLIN
ncbi:MAG: tetratricopeptide repeat protein [Deltaproteobacteria bacterium]|nr:tetratricopeptide repeat protein [Deltaproteobacteria bacterium]